METGIKEITELFDGLDLIAEAGGKVYADKKVDMSDLPVLINIAVNAKTVLDAISGLKGVKAEAADLDSTEQFEIVKRLFQVAEKYETARKS